jgi:cytochrome c oxidase subunit 3
LATLAKSTTGGPPPIDPELPFGGDRNGDGDGVPTGTRGASITGIFVLICASLMTFAALVSAMVVRRGLNDSDWNRLPLPGILWWNTGLLLVSSIVIDIARRRLKQGRREVFNQLWTIGVFLGTLFLVGQIVAWTQIDQRGFAMARNLGTAFFYVLTWTHAAHVVGALAAVWYVEYRALRYELGTSGRTWVVVSAIFWHFLDILWLFIMALFAFWA